MAASAHAQQYPVKPVRIVVPFPPGGSVDVFARILAPKLSESLGLQVVIDNRSFASGNIGTELAARAATDGYTLLANTLPSSTNPAMPAVPTIAEAGVVGLAGYDFTPWQITAVPAGTPAAITAQLNEHLVKAMRSPDIAERMARDGADVIASSQPDAVKHVQAEMDKWRRVIKERGMRAE